MYKILYAEIIQKEEVKKFHIQFNSNSESGYSFTQLNWHIIMKLNQLTKMAEIKKNKK